ncbi:MAG: hypothetical protein AAGC70_14555 [Pseudomonadota bacterium]
MKNWYFVLAAVSVLVVATPRSLAQTPVTTENQSEVSPPATGIKAPLVERYILDELRALRTELGETRAQMIREITDRELRVADNVSSVANNTVTFFFYVFVGLSALFGVWGWRSMRDLKDAVTTSAETEILRLSAEFETRLARLESELHSKGEIILENQREIERTQTVHALWLQANQAQDPRIKVEFYDKILELAPGDLETMAYKADAALELGDRDWALSLCNRILEQDPNSAHALYQRACARAGLGELDGAMADLSSAIELLPAMRDHAAQEDEFTPLAERDDFAAIIPQSRTQDAETA